MPSLGNELRVYVLPSQAWVMPIIAKVRKTAYVKGDKLQ